MFEAFECDRITVPSCDKHNSEKNLIDRAVVTFFLRGLYPAFKYGTLTPNVLKAFGAAQQKLRHAREVTLRPLVSDPLGELDTGLSYISKMAIVQTWMRQLTAALVWSVVGGFDPAINWDAATVWSPEFISGTGLLEVGAAQDQLARLQSMRADINNRAVEWWPGWSAFPREYPRDIYRFEVSLLPSQYLLDSGNRLEVAFRHRFYGQFSWDVWFTSSSETKAILANTVKVLHSG